MRALIMALLILSLPSVAEADAWHVAGTTAILATPVSFESHGATLRGMLYRPDSKTLMPAVVAFHGAGIGNADAALYKHLREGLPVIGIAVLVFDRRGTGRSTGSLNDVGYETPADDGIAGARAIARFPSIDPAKIGYWGLSQGGWLGVFAALRDPKAAFAISVSAPLVTPEPQRDARGACCVDWVFARCGVASGCARRACGNRQEAVFPLMYVPSSQELTTNPATSSWREEMDDDPITAVRSINVPLLLLYGGADPSIPVDATMDRLRALSKPTSSLTSSPARRTK